MALHNISTHATISRIIFLGALFILVVLNTGCAPNNDELFESSNALLTIDRQWTDITTYQEKYSGLLPFVPKSESPELLGRSTWPTVTTYISNNTKRLRDLRFALNLVEAEVDSELLLVKLALANVYDQELELFTLDKWRPFQNYQNAGDYIEEYSFIPAAGRDIYNQWMADTFQSPWVDVQLKREITYERWMGILEEHQASAELIEEFNRTISKQ